MGFKLTMPPKLMDGTEPDGLAYYTIHDRAALGGALMLCEYRQRSTHAQRGSVKLSHAARALPRSRYVHPPTPVIRLLINSALLCSSLSFRVSARADEVAA